MSRSQKQTKGNHEVSAPVSKDEQEKLADQISFYTEIGCLGWLLIFGMMLILAALGVKNDNFLQGMLVNCGTEIFGAILVYVVLDRVLKTRLKKSNSLKYARAAFERTGRVLEFLFFR